MTLTQESNEFKSMYHNWTTGIQSRLELELRELQEKVPRKRWNLRNMYNLEQIKMIKAEVSGKKGKET